MGRRLQLRFDPQPGEPPYAAGAVQEMAKKKKKKKRSALTGFAIYDHDWEGLRELLLCRPGGG